MFYQILISSHFDIVDSGWSFCKQYLFNFVFNCIFIFAHYKQAEKVVCCWCRLLVALVTTVPLSHVNWRSCSWIVTRTERCLLNQYRSTSGPTTALVHLNGGSTLTSFSFKWKKDKFISEKHGEDVSEMTLQLYFYLFVSFKDNFFFSGIEVKQTVMALPIRGSRSCYITSSLKFNFCL